MSYYAWSGHEHHANVTQTARAMSLLYALTGSFDRPGGNVLFAAPPAAPIAGQELPAAQQMAPAVGLAERPLGPARWGFVATHDLYRAILEGTPYPVRAVIGFGANMLLAHADGGHGREALEALDFYAHADLFMNPTAEMADVVLPVASAFEREGLKIGFEISPEAQSLIQLRPAVVPPPGEARPDTDIIFDLAARLGLGGAVLARRHRGRLPPPARAHRRHPGAVARRARRRAGAVADPPRQARRAGRERRAARLCHALAQGRALLGNVPRSRLRAAARFLGAASRPGGAARPGGALPADPDEREVRAVLPDPAPRAAEPAQARSASGSGAASRWRRRRAGSPTATGCRSRRRRAACAPAPGSTRTSIRAWWWASTAGGRPVPRLGAPGYDPFGPPGANFNLLIGTAALDPVSGTASHRSYLCEIRSIAQEEVSGS